MTVYKYQLPGTLNSLYLPAGAKPLTARFQDSTFGNGFMLWCLVDTDEPVKETREFVVVATGAEIVYPENTNALEYISSIETPQGLMFHVFEIV